MFWKVLAIPHRRSGGSSCRSCARRSGRTNPPSDGIRR
jgi:hypothetical protein